MDLLEEVFHSPGMKALFFHIGELVNTVHATAVPTKGSSATGIHGLAQPVVNRAEKHHIAKHSAAGLPKSTLSFQNLT